MKKFLPLAISLLFICFINNPAYATVQVRVENHSAAILWVHIDGQNGSDIMGGEKLTYPSIAPQKQDKYMQIGFRGHAFTDQNSYMPLCAFKLDESKKAIITQRFYLTSDKQHKYEYTCSVEKL